MPRKKRNVQFKARDYTAKQLIDLDVKEISKMTRRELSRIVSTIGDVANKRLARLQSKGIQSPASFSDGGYMERISVKGKTVNELRAEYMRARSFLTAKTSTIQGVKEWKSASMRELGRYGVNITGAQFDRFWQAYEKLKDLDARADMRGIKYSIMADLSTELEERDDLSIDEIVEDIQGKINTIYEYQEAKNGISSIGELFNQQGGGFGSNY